MLEKSFQKNIFGESINLIELSIDRLDEMWNYSADSRLYEYFEFEPHQSRDDTEVYLDKLIHRCEEGKSYRWFIEISKTSKVIGTFGVHDINLLRNSCEISYAVSPSYWGKSMFKCTLDMALDMLINKLLFHRIVAITASDNIRSVKSLSNFGFLKEGELQDYYYNNNKDKRYNAMLLALVSDNYTKVYN
jgi:ribosomal-protein-alanine N-acetyltransferase